MKIPRAITGGGGNVEIDKNAIIQRFGVERYTCIGQELAIVEMRRTLVRSWKFDWECGPVMDAVVDEK
ncbi:cytochrome P450 [Penicillium hispanicum]|uniref:cytochrome P450 n=1 Tax=Penicillium hispanicum TaxID=1080232 RepID=UPI0025405641|nr:cytochrome P450 [Penicillium hispanicum]KAJ5579752.1 cytochrome P450 [Penicillium hispanicum]